MSAEAGPSLTWTHGVSLRPQSQGSVLPYRPVSWPLWPPGSDRCLPLAPQPRPHESPQLHFWSCPLLSLLQPLCSLLTGAPLTRQALTASGLSVRSPYSSDENTPLLPAARLTPMLPRVPLGPLPSVLRAWASPLSSLSSGLHSSCREAYSGPPAWADTSPPLNTLLWPQPSAVCGVCVYGSSLLLLCLHVAQGGSSVWFSSSQPQH